MLWPLLWAERVMVVFQSGQCDSADGWDKSMHKVQRYLLMLRAVTDTWQTKSNTCGGHRATHDV